jgi:hypothetical protein
LNPDVSKQLEKLSRMLAEVGLRDGIQGLRLSHEGTAMLALSGGKKLGFEYNEELDSLLLHMPVMNLPTDSGRRLAMLEAMLAKNHLKSGGVRGELALDEQREQAIYQCALPVDSLDADRLDREIDIFLRQRDLFRFSLESGGDIQARERAPMISQRVHPLQRLARQ